MIKKGSLFSAAILLAGASIGTGFYAIPIAAGPAGFYPAVVMTILVWGYMIATGLLYLEATLACPDGANVISITSRLIGPVGMITGLLSFLFINLFYFCILFAFTSDFFTHVFDYWLDLSIAKIWFKCGCFLLFGGIVFLGTYVSDRVNFVLFTGLLIAFFATLLLGGEKVELTNLKTNQWYLVVFSVPVIVTAFDYQGLLPTLSTYLKRDATRLVKMVLVALAFPLIVYIGWQWLVIGSTSHSLLWEAFEKGVPIFEGLLLLRGELHFQMALHFLIFFAMTTSFIGVGLAFTDFVSDAFKIPVDKRKGLRRLFPAFSPFIIGLLLNLILPISALVTTGYFVGWGEVVFNGAIPLWLAIRIRYILKLDHKELLPGGKWLIALLLAGTFFLIYLEGVHVLRA